MNSSSVATVCIDCRGDSVPIGTVRSKPLLLVKGKGGPDRWGLFTCMGSGWSATFNLVEPLGDEAWAFAGQKKLATRGLRLNSTCWDRPRGSVVEEEPINGWRVEFWVFGHKLCHQVPRACFEGGYNTATREGTLNMSELVLPAIRDAVGLPDFRWRRDITEVLKVSHVILDRPMELPSTMVVRSVSFKFRAGRHEACLAPSHQEQPLILLKNPQIPGDNYYIPLSAAILNPNVHITFDRPELNNA